MVRSPGGIARVHTRGTSRFPIEALESRRLLSAGDLDLSFGGDGKVTTDLPGSQFEDGFAVVVQADNKAVAAGQVRRPGDLYGDMLVVRYNPDGSLDTTFGGGDGWVAVDFEGRDDLARDIALAPGGKIVVAGYSAETVTPRPPGQPPLPGNLDFAVARLNADGSLDTTFDGNGRRRIDVAGRAVDQANDVAVRPDGGVYLIGRGAAIVALRPDGSPDPAFDGDGILDAPLPAPAEGPIAGELDADGRILVAANQVTFPGTPDSYFLARYLPDGRLDSTFGGGTLGPAPGVVRVQLVSGVFPPFFPFVADLAIAPGGKIVTVGDFGAMRFNPDGTRDTTFDGDGRAAGRDNYAVVVQSDGSILTGGNIQVTNGTPRLTRYRPDGSVDSSFSGTNGYGSILDIALAPDGRSVTVGTATPGHLVFNAAASPDLAVTRRLTTGALDPNFGPGTFPGGYPAPGIAITDLTGPGASTVVDVATLPGGKVVALGDHVSGNNQQSIALVRYNADGSPDTTFGAAGTGIIYASDEGYLNGASSVVAQPDGKILAAGYIRNPVNSTEQVLILRYNADGRPDASFGTGGRVVIARVGNVAPIPSAGQDLVVQHDGRIVLATTVSASRVGLVRMMPGGAVDPSLGGIGGVATTLFAPAVDVELAPAGKIVVAANSSGRYEVGRFNADGTRDEGFRTISRSTGTASALAVAPGGEIVIAGTTATLMTRDFFVERFDASGQRDTSFGTNRSGLVTTDLGGDEVLGDMALLPDNSVVVVGMTRPQNVAETRVTGDFAVARYTPAGALDTGFGGGDGFVTADFAGGADSAAAVAVDAEGRIVAGGQAFAEGRSTDFALARLEGGGPLGPNVAELSVGNPTFAAPFRAYLDAFGAGGAAGFSVVNFAGNVSVFPPVSVTQIGVSQVAARLRGPGSDGLVGADDLRVRGVNVADYGVAGFAYDPASRLATWTLDRPISNDRVAVEMNTDADPAPELRWRVDVLAGDADGSVGRQVTAIDLAEVRRRLGKVATLPPVFTSSGYSHVADVTGDGRINALDMAVVKQRLGQRLPAGQPPASTAVDAAAADSVTATSFLLRRRSDVLLQSPVGGR